jgi:putative membrane protein
MKLLAVFLGVVTAACAHEGRPPAPHDVLYEWSLDPGVILPMLLAAALYWRGASDEHGVSRRERRCFWSGWWALAAGLVSPLHATGEALFSAHMLQHEVLMLIAAPLLVLGRPLVPFLWGLPMSWRRAAGAVARSRAVSAVWSWLSRPLNAWWIHAVVLWAWHIPSAFEATVVSDLAHSLQHAGFLGSALLFWWALLQGRDSALGSGKAVLYVFSTGVHSALLGALLTFSPFVWYPVYKGRTEPWGLTPLEDQQIGGLIMWVPSGLVFVAAGLWLFARWIEEPPARAPRCPTTAE